MPIHHSYDNEKIWLRRVHWTSRLRWNQDAGGNLRGIYGSYSNLPTRGKEALERDHQHESNMSSPLSMRDMPMQATPSPWCLVVALQPAEYTEGIRCDRAFSVVQGAGKGCTIRQDCLVGFKDHGFNQKCALAEAMENLPNGRHHRVMYYPNSPHKQVPLALSGVKSRKLSSLPTEDTASVLASVISLRHG